MGVGETQAMVKRGLHQGIGARRASEHVEVLRQASGALCRSSRGVSLRCILRRSASVQDRTVTSQGITKFWRVPMITSGLGNADTVLAASLRMRPVFIRHQEGAVTVRRHHVIDLPCVGVNLRV
jgi:hypothetical protein